VTSPLSFISTEEKFFSLTLIYFPCFHLFPLLSELLIDMAKKRTRSNSKKKTISGMRKSELQDLALEFGLQSDGNIKILREIISNHLTEHADTLAVDPTYSHLYSSRHNQRARSPTPPVPQSPPVAESTGDTDPQVEEESWGGMDFGRDASTPPVSHHTRHSSSIHDDPSDSTSTAVMIRKIQNGTHYLFCFLFPYSLGILLLLGSHHSYDAPLLYALIYRIRAVLYAATVRLRLL